MTPQARIRRFGWIATLSICLVCYIMLHLKVNAVHAEVVRAEKEIVRLERHNLLLETEVLTRSNQVKLAEWNRVEFGYRAPHAEQYIESDRRLGELGGPRQQDAPAPIRLATITTGEDAPAFPTLPAPSQTKPAAQAGALSDRVRVEITNAAGI